MGVFTGSGFLALSIFTQGVLANSALVKLLSSVPHLALGLCGMVTGFLPADEN